MSRSAPRPTDAELAILRILWERGPSTVRQVHEQLARERVTAYTTALKLLQIMTEKGLVERDTTGWRHVYRARFSRTRTQKQIVRNLLDRAFEGSSHQLVMQALSAKKASRAELDEIQKLIDEMKGA